MKKKTTKIHAGRQRKKEDYSPETVAKNFWLNWYQTVTQKMSDSIMNRLDIDPAEKKHHIDYISKKKSLPPDQPVGSLESMKLDFNYLQKPNTDWDKIKNCLRDLNIDNKEMELLVFILKHTPLEQTLIPKENPALTAIKDAEDSLVSEFNQKKLALSPLVGLLEKLRQEDSSYKKFRPLLDTIEVFNYDIALCTELIKRKHDTDRQWLDMYCLDKDLKKSPQKHNYWNHVVSFAIGRLNKYCHNEHCGSKCGKTHEKAIRKVAELLKILYPTIWIEDVQIIAKRIKQKDYRPIPK